MSANPARVTDEQPAEPPPGWREGLRRCVAEDVAALAAGGWSRDDSVTLSVDAVAAAVTAALTAGVRAGLDSGDH